MLTEMSAAPDSAAHKAVQFVVMYRMSFEVVASEMDVPKVPLAGTFSGPAWLNEPRGAAAAVGEALKTMVTVDWDDIDAHRCT